MESNEITKVDIPVSPIGIQNLTTEVMTNVKRAISMIQRNIPENQIRSIVVVVVQEIIDQLVSATQDRDNE